MIAWFIEKANAQPGAEGGEVLPFDAIVIILILIVNAVLGYMQEAKAEAAVEALAQMTAPQTSVLRDDKVMRINTADVVPGDIIVLAEGDSVSADGRLVNAASLRIAEASLTGESVPVGKKPDTLTEAKALGDRANMIFNGTSVTQGTGRAIVTGTGMNTQVGKIADMLSATEDEKTPLQKEMDYVSKILGIAVCVIAVVVLVALAVLEGFNDVHDVIDSLLLAVSLAVAAVPEGLAAILTVVLALGVQRMAAHNAIVKKLHSVETLGSASVICSDKTGTLTQNRMSVQKIYVGDALVDFDDISMDDELQRQLVEIGLLASDATTDEETGSQIGDPTEVALVHIGDSLGIDEGSYRASHPRLRELAFDSDRKLMSTLHELPRGIMLLTKGAPDVLLARSTFVLTADGPAVLTEERKAEIAEANSRLSEQGLRVLAFAMREIGEVRDLALADESDFTFVGLAAMMDPPRPEAVAAVADAKRAGIRTIMITGDHKVTASAIAREIGIMEPGDEVLDGAELDRLSDAELDGELPRISVYARVSPEHKIRIVSAWQRRGAIVAMTGDGVNDAPALKRADIGIAMGITGTEVSKDAAAMILSDDNFATIVKAVENGRGVYANIKNTVHFLLSGNMAGIICVLFASIAGLAAPFAPVHLLFINLLTDSLPAISIGMEPVAEDVLDHKPRDPKGSILDRSLLIRIGVEGVLIAIPTMTAFFIGLAEAGAALGMTMAFATLSLARLFHGFNCRGDASIARLGVSSNPYTLFAFVGGAALLAAVLFIPFLHPLIQIADVTIGQAGLIVALAFAPTLVIQVYRMARDLIRR